MKKLFVALCTSLIAAVFLFGGMVSDAQANPDYLKWKWVSYKVMENNKYPAGDKRHCFLRVWIQYTNVSNNKIVTALFKKFIGVAGAWNGGAGVFTASVSSNKVNKVELYPGASIKLHYDLQLIRLETRLAGYGRLQDALKLFIKENKISKTRMNHTFNAQAKPL